MRRWLLAAVLIAVGMISAPTALRFTREVKTVPAHPLSPTAVLETLDQLMTYARGDLPPPPDIYNINHQFVQGRLSVLRNDAHWVVAVETVCYVPGLYAYTHNLHLYEYHGEAFAYWDWHELPIDIIREDLWDGDRFLVRRDRPRVYWGGRWRTFAATPADYAAAGVVFPPARRHTNDLEPIELLALLCWKFRSSFFLSEADLLQTVRNATGSDVKWRLIFQTERWQHPDVGQGEHPSDVPGMRVLAELIATGDASV